MICNKCEKEIAENSKSCVHCGSDDLKKEAIKEKPIKNIINRIISHKFIISAIVVLISITVIITAVILADKKDNEIVKEEKIEENNITEENMEEYTEEKNIEPDINLIKENFKLSYNSLLEQISSYNISNVSSYSTSSFNTYRALQSPTNGYIFAVYNKTNGKIEYTQNYGKGVGTEITWVNYEADSPMAKYEGHYGEKTTEAFVVMALTNYSGKPTYVVDNRKNETFSTMSKYMKGRLEENSSYESQELKDYEIIKYRWIKDGEELKINIEMKTNKREREDEENSKYNTKSRPYAIMISNNHDSWPQCGIQDAYLVYEIIVEGGITRMMALYKDQEIAKIGSITSARSYFIDYAEENDAIFMHWGGSPQAYSRLDSIDSLDGIPLEGSIFFRDTSLNRALEHTRFADLKKAKEYGEQKGYNRDVNVKLLLNYCTKEIDMDAIPNAKPANSVTIKYSDNHLTSYEYDSENKVYNRSMSGEPNIDLNTGKQYTAKNIIAYKVRNYTSDDKGRQELDNIGTGTGYYITEGKAIPITWEKYSHSGQTTYRYENGAELKVNEGNTFIQIYPVEYEISIL